MPFSNGGTAGGGQSQAPQGEPASEGIYRSLWRIEGLALRKGSEQDRAGPRDTLSKREGGRIEFTELNLFFRD